MRALLLLCITTALSRVGAAPLPGSVQVKTATNTNVDPASLLTACLQAVNSTSMTVSPSQNTFSQYPEGKWIRNLAERTSVQPILVVHPKTDTDVSAAVKCAATANVKICAVGGGRHTYEAICSEDSLMIVLNQGAFDRDTEIGWLNRRGPNNGPIVEVVTSKQLGQVYAALGAKGYALPGGTCPTVGISGLTLGGGKGYLIRQHGLLSDKLVGIDYVDSVGDLKTADATTNSDMFWLARGMGGQQFPAVVLRFRFEAVPISDVVTTFTFDFEHEQAAASLARFQSSVVFSRDKKLWARWTMWAQPNGGAKPRAGITGVYTGSMLEAKEVIKEALFCGDVNQGCRDLGPPVDHFEDSFVSGTWFHAVARNGAPAGNPISEGGCAKDGKIDWDVCAAKILSGTYGYGSGFESNNKFKSRGFVFKPLDMASIQRVIDSLTAATWVTNPYQLYFQIDPADGAVDLLSPTDTPYPWRDASTPHLTSQLHLAWNNDADSPDPGYLKTEAMLQSWVDATKAPYMSYVNYIDCQMGTPAAYWGENAERVAKLTWQLDPNGLFASGTCGNRLPSRPS